MNSVCFRGFSDELVKIAKTRLLKYLSSLPGQAQAAAVKALPGSMRETASYKLLGQRAADVARRMPGEAGHGAEHVLSVTKNTQALTQGMPQQVRQRATLGALLHDVGREAEGGVRSRVGKQVFKQSPELWHSELGGRYAKNFLQQNKQLARNVPGLERGQLSGSVRAHDTDIHKLKPWTAKRVAQDPASGAVYMGDKMEGMGRVGAERTVQMAQKFKEAPAETMNVVGKNVQKYRNVANMATPAQQKVLNPKITEYENLMGHYGRTGALPTMSKAAMSVRDFKRVYEAGLEQRWSAPQMQRVVSNLAKRVSDSKAEMFQAIYELPEMARLKVMNMLTEGPGQGLKLVK